MQENMSKNTLCGLWFKRVIFRDRIIILLVIQCNMNEWELICWWKFMVGLLKHICVITFICLQIWWFMCVLLYIGIEAMLKV